MRRKCRIQVDDRHCERCEMTRTKRPMADGVNSCDMKFRNVILTAVIGDWRRLPGRIDPRAAFQFVDRRKKINSDWSPETQLPSATIIFSSILHLHILKEHTAYPQTLLAAGIPLNSASFVHHHRHRKIPSLSNAPRTHLRDIKSRGSN